MVDGFAVGGARRGAFHVLDGKIKEAGAARHLAVARQPGVAAREDDHIRIVVLSDRICPVGIRDAVEVPLVADQLGNEIIVRPRSDRTEGVHRIHHAARAAHRLFGDRAVFVGGIFDGLAGYADGHLKRLGVHFAHDLLGRPGIGGLPIGLLIVEGEVLHVFDEAAIGRAVDHVGDEHTRQERVFRIIFHVTAAEGGAVQVEGGRIARGATVCQRLRCHGGADILEKFHVPGARHHGAHAPGHRQHLLFFAAAHADAVGALGMDGAGQADGRDLGRVIVGTEQKLFDGVVVRFPVDLVEQVVPHRVVIVFAAQVADDEAVVLVGNRHHVGIDLAVRIGADLRIGRGVIIHTFVEKIDELL